MRSSHWAAFAVFLGALATLISGLDHWSDALQPSFIGATLAMLSSLIIAMGAKQLVSGTPTAAAIDSVKAGFAKFLPKGQP